MRQWINLVEGTSTLGETLWVNARTGEIIDVAKEGAAHHNEYTIDNPDRVGVRASSRMLQKARLMDYEDMIADPLIRKEPTKAHWVRTNYNLATGWTMMDALSETDIIHACLAMLDAGYIVNELTVEIGGNRQNWKKYRGKELTDFLHG